MMSKSDHSELNVSPAGFSSVLITRSGFTQCHGMLFLLWTQQCEVKVYSYTFPVHACLRSNCILQLLQCPFCHKDDTMYESAVIDTKFFGIDSQLSLKGNYQYYYQVIYY